MLRNTMIVDISQSNDNIAIELTNVRKWFLNHKRRIQETKISYVGSSVMIIDFWYV